MHGALIEKESFMEEKFSIPSNVEQVATMLPGNTQYDDIDELLITIGKHQERSMLHSFVSKLFKVPQRVLIEADQDRESLVPQSVLEAVNQNRQRAKDAAEAVRSASSIPQERHGTADTQWPKPAETLEKFVGSVVNGTTEYADPEHLCEICLPIFGDEIVGTRPVDDIDAIPKVHRVGCPHAQRAINRALAENSGSAVGRSDALGERIDSVTLRRSMRNPSLLSKDSTDCSVPVHLEWDEFPGPDEKELSFPCEVVVHAEDRKLLLADCSEVVSELSEIIKTGSQTTNEHATLVFLIQVRGIDELQQLMDSLRKIRSVMSVERRVSLPVFVSSTCDAL